ncbi:hypothetical protein FA13DRAFT_1031126 [Coprinellus micaceus]|uniref:Uncharacterized protein n=1 Tax=Coprinellus micaceus TaxID=71717 RepID=A0A4Y7SYD7_COPMI|nr:hypothetical protein FA13DRAFT_1031126 [Coprinellus micaceus]
MRTWATPSFSICKFHPHPQTCSLTHFLTLNHQNLAIQIIVVQSMSFAEPCTKYGFFKANGVNLNSEDSLEKRSDLPPGAVGMFSWTLQVSGPLIMYSPQLCPMNYCKEGLVLAINPLANQTHDKLLENARSSPDPPQEDCSWFKSKSSTPNDTATTPSVSPYITGTSNVHPRRRECSEAC